MKHRTNQPATADHTTKDTATPFSSDRPGSAGHTATAIGVGHFQDAPS